MRNVHFNLKSLLCNHITISSLADVKNVVMLKKSISLLRVDKAFFQLIIFPLASDFPFDHDECQLAAGCCC